MSLTHHPDNPVDANASQGYKGKTRYLMHNPNDDTQNYTCRRLKLVVETFKHSTQWSTNQHILKFPKLLIPTNRIMLLQNFGD